MGLRFPWYSPSIQIHRRLHAQLQGPFDRLNARGEKFIDDENEESARNTMGLFDFMQYKRMMQEMELRMNQPEIREAQQRRGMRARASQ